MKNIGILVYDCSLTGGAERVAIAMAEEFSAKYKIHLISLYCEKEETIPKDDRYYTHVVHPKTVSITKNFLSLSSALRRYLKENRIDLLFSITAGVVTLAIHAARGKGIKTVFCEHSTLENKTYGKKHELRQFLGAKLCDRSVALTERDRGNFLRMYKMPEDKVVTILNWSDAKIALAPYNADSKKIIAVGRLEAVKGYDKMIAAVQKVFAVHPDWHLDIYGGGTYQERIQKDIDDRGLSGSVTLHGDCRNVHSRYGEYSFFIQTSYYEGFSLTLLEARRAGLPVVSFDCPTGPSEIVDHGLNGILVPAYDVDQLGREICALIEDRERRISMAAHSQDDLEKFSKEKLLQQWDALIDSLIK